ncbi:MAG: macro domain-containing protein, partial [Leptolyngbyaceae cyanobacterium MAG.088]|nr:macro domain-containing protein [Leptolyngbyaceae cyanobacterium MAG.088]
GATFYHAIVRQPPFEAETPWSVVWKHKTEPLIPPKSLNPSVSSVLNDCLERCLAKDPADRFSSFAQINEVLNSTSIRPWEHTIDETLANYLGIFKIHRKQFLSPDPAEIGHPTIFDFPNRRRLKILFGDLTEQTVDALVSSDDAMLTMNSGVSAALAEKAGGSFREDAQCFTPARAGRVVVTPAGDLPARFVFHGISIGMDGEYQQFPTRDVIAEIVDSCFYQAETLSIKSIAFPILGTGNGGFPRGVALDTMFRIIAHRLLRRITPIKEVRIVLWPQATNSSADMTLVLD